MPQSPLCPVQMYELMCSLVPTPPQSPAFLLPTKASHTVTVTKSQFVSFFGTCFVGQVFQIIARFGVTHFDGGPLLGLFV